MVLPFEFTEKAVYHFQESNTDESKFGMVVKRVACAFEVEAVSSCQQEAKAFRSN